MNLKNVYFRANIDIFFELTKQRKRKYENKKEIDVLFGFSLTYLYLCTLFIYMDNKQKALELGTKPVGQLLWQYALPAIVAMTASSLYNIIDRAMIG